MVNWQDKPPVQINHYAHTHNTEQMFEMFLSCWHIPDLHPKQNPNSLILVVQNQLWLYFFLQFYILVNVFHQVVLHYDNIDMKYNMGFFETHNHWAQNRIHRQEDRPQDHYLRLDRHQKDRFLHYLDRLD